MGQKFIIKRFKYIKIFYHNTLNKKKDILQSDLVFQKNQEKRIENNVSILLEKL